MSYGWAIRSMKAMLNRQRGKRTSSSASVDACGRRDGRNVDPASTMQVADALIKAGKDFELVVIPGARHTMGEDFGERKRYDFFVKNLLGVTPPSWLEVPLP